MGAQRAERMRANKRLVIAAAAAVTLGLGCKGANRAATGTRDTKQRDGGTSVTSSAGKGVSAGAGKAGSASAGSAGSASAGKAGSATSRKAGAGGMSGREAAGAAAVSGRGGSSAGGAGGGGRAGGAGESTQMMSNSCSKPAHVLPLNPQDAQDGITLS